MTGSLARRGVILRVDVTGNEAAAMKKSVVKGLSDDPLAQEIWYTNSKSSAEGSLLDLAISVLEERKEAIRYNTTATALTGGDGVMKKVHTMDEFTSYGKINEEGRLPDGENDEAGDMKWKRVQILVATLAANCGVSSRTCKKARHKGLPPSFYDFVQEFGRVDRNLSAVPGENEYVVHISFRSVVSLYARIMKSSSTVERAIQVSAMLEVLQFLLSPSECYHLHLERHFEGDDAGEKQGCAKYCSFCLGDVPKLTKRVNKDVLVSLLTTDVFKEDKSIEFKELLKRLRKEKDILFHTDDVPKKNMGQLHALCLQLVAKGIVELLLAMEATSSSFSSDSESASYSSSSWRHASVPHNLS
ncbi:hypothetical protein ACHAWF_009916 [Thalassiosira exigua]